MKAFGSDRLATPAEGRFVISSRFDKGWVPRLEETSTSPLTPGTTVRWDDGFWEVREAHRRADGAVSYVLAPWDEQYIFRVVEDYSEEAEEARRQARREESLRTTKRHLSWGMALVVGLLPGEVQERLELETGVKATRLTLLSAAPHFAYGVYSLIMLLAGAFGAGHGVQVLTPPLWAMVLGEYLLFESCARIVVALSQDRPMGSIFGLLAHGVWGLRKPGSWRPSREPASLGDGPSAEQELYDSFQMREVFLGLLPPRDQELLRERFGFEPVKWGWITATLVLAVAGLNLLLSLSALRIGVVGAGDWAWLFAGGLLSIEQLLRMPALARKEPAGSVLGILVRPFCRRILAVHPAAS